MREEAAFPQIKTAIFIINNNQALNKRPITIRSLLPLQQCDVILQHNECLTAAPNPDFGSR